MDKWDVAECLSMIADEEYRYKQISGCVQSEWQDVYYNKHIDIDKLEADYFNTGTEWRVIESDEDYEDAYELPTEDAYYVYCYGYNDDMIKQELSDVSGVSVEDIVLFKYEGYIQMPKYSRVQEDDMKLFFTTFGLLMFVNAIVLLINYFQFREFYFSIANSIMAVIICIFS